jgi:putative membrane protein
MMGYYYDGMWGFGGFFMLIFWVAVIWAFFALIRMTMHSGSDHSHRKPYSEDASMKILRERYARGEIDKKEFDEKMRDLADEWKV